MHLGIREKNVLLAAGRLEISARRKCEKNVLRGAYATRVILVFEILSRDPHTDPSTPPEHDAAIASLY